MGKLERAKIYRLKDDNQSYDVNDAIDVCFNPKEYSLDKTVEWQPEKAHSDAPMVEFTKPAAMTMTVTLQFDTYEERVSVRDKYMRKIESLTMMRSPAKDEKDVKKHSPPLILFVWGRLTFKGAIDSLSQKYTMFLADGTPVRAECTLKIRNVLEAKIDHDKLNPSMSVSGGGKSYTVQQGDRLDSIAATQLGDAGKWTSIALANNIDDPTALRAGMTLSIPADD